MNLIVNKSQISSTAEIFAQMLQESSSTDTHLLLAYGYMDFDKDLAKAVIDWMQKDSKRSVIFIVGIHGRHSLTSYESERMKRTDVPSFEESNQAKVIGTVMAYARKFSFDVIEDLDRWKVAAIYGFHAKISALMEMRDSDTLYDDLYEVIDVDPQGEGPFLPVEFIMGSTNFTGAGMAENIELDMHMRRSEVNLDMIAQINNLISVAAKKLKADDLSQKVTEKISEELTDLFYKKRKKGHAW